MEGRVRECNNKIYDLREITSNNVESIKNNTEQIGYGQGKVSENYKVLENKILKSTAGGGVTTSNVVCRHNNNEERRKLGILGYNMGKSYGILNDVESYFKKMNSNLEENENLEILQQFLKGNEWWSIIKRERAINSQV